MSIDISYGELIVIDGININEGLVSAGQHAIAYALRRGNPGGEPLIGISAENFYFSNNLNISGNVGIGKASSNYQLDVSGDIYCKSITTAFSDSRLKTSIMPLKCVLEKINNLSGFTYKPNEKALELGLAKDKDQISVGLSAQKVKQVAPETVQEIGETGYLTIQYERLVPLLIEGIKDLNKKVERLEEKINKRD
tara:strand:+ start:429 stop:1013 length:585 start_codon:yes stop_codon:yes gene_type:complete